MKISKIYVTALVLFLAFSPMHGQILKNLGKKVQKAVERGVEKTVERKTQEKAEEKTGEIIDEVLDDKSKENTNSNDVNADDFENQIKGIMKSGSFDANAGSELKCPIMKVSDVYVAVAKPSEKRLVRAQEENSCGYEIDIFGGTIPLTITAHKMSESQMKKEIENYKNDPSGMLSAQQSSTGNATFGIHKPNKWLIIFNPASDYVYKLNFSTTAYSALHQDKTMVNYDKAKKSITSIANYLVKNK